MVDRPTQKRIWVFLAPVLTAAVLLGVYALRGIYPFGALTVAQGDLEQQYCAMYTQLYDVMRGEASPLFSWLTALGRGQSMDMMIFGCFSPLNLLLLLFPRDGLLAAMSYFVLLKLALAALAMSWYVRRRFPSLSPLWTVFFGVAYGLSGFSMMHFHNTLWLEAVILLPFYLYYAERMLLNGRVLPYALLLAALLLFNFYPAAMVCLFTFFIGGAYILLLLEKPARGRAVLRIAAGTLLALLLSGFRTVPAALQMVDAARLGFADTSLFAPFTGYSWERGFALATAGIALMLLPWRVRALLKSGEGRKVAFFLATLAVMLLPLLFDSIDRLWHFGGNIGFPHRFGFLTVFAVLALSAEALTHWETRPSGSAGKWKLAAQYGVTALVLVVFCYVTLRDGRRVVNFFTWNQALLAVLTIAAGAAYLCALTLDNRRAGRALCLGILLLQTSCYAFSAFVAPDTVDLSAASSAQAAALRTAFYETDDVSRVKVEDASLTINYPKYLGRPALSSFSSSTTQRTLDTAKAMGYGISAYAIQDCGGTLFSDALLHVTATVSHSDRFLHDDAYRLRARVNDFYVYDNAVTLPFGLVGSGALADIDPAQYGDCFLLQNALYAAFSGDDVPLFTEETPAFAAASEQDAVRWLTVFPETGYGEPITSFAAASITVSGTRRVYLYDRGVRGAKLSALVERDGERVRVTDAHPITYLDGAYDLGTFTNETIMLAVAGDADTVNANVCVYLMDTARLAAFADEQSAAPAVQDVTTGKRSMTLTVTAARDTDFLFLPIQYSGNWRIRLDGRAVTPCAIAGDYMGLALMAGTHTLSMTYWPKGLTAGIVCSALALLAALWLFLRERRGALLFASIPDRADAWLRRALAALWCAAMLLCYALPALFGLAAWYRNLH